MQQNTNFYPQNAIIDGIFWKDTENAVKKFQKSRNLVADGVVGNNTWKSLESYSLNNMQSPNTKNIFV